MKIGRSYKGLFWFLLITLNSCSSSYQLTIEIREPAPLTLPIPVNQVFIVNNTVPQPNTVGVNRIYDGKMLEDYELELDSVSWIAFESLAFRLMKASVFDRVYRYKKSVRNDNEWIAVIPLSETFKDKLFQNQEWDAIISIDRILFNLEEEIKTTFPCHKDGWNS